MSDDQFGFRRGKGTREAILALRQILERRIALNIPTFATFIDLEKAFDKVDWRLLFTTLKEKGIDWRDRRMIFKLYATQTTLIDINGITKEAKINQGVRQGCPLSPYLFNLFIEKAIDQMKETSNGIKINGQRIHCIRFADDIVNLSDTESDMNTMLNELDASLKQFSLKINANKTKTMFICKASINPESDIKIGNNKIQQVKTFTYLGSIVNTNNDSSRDINQRIILAKKAFQNKYNLLTNKHITTETKKKFIKTLIWSVLLYGCETWIITIRDKKKLEAAEMWFWRKMCKTSWREKKSNEKLLSEIKERRQLIQSLESRQIKLIGHTIRHNNFLCNIFEGRLEGRRCRGRPRKCYFKDIMEIMKCKTYRELKYLAANRQEWLQRQGAAFR